MSEFIFKKSVDSFIYDFYKTLNIFKKELRENYDEQIHLYSLINNDILYLRKRRTDIKQSINLSKYNINLCEEEIGISLYKS